MAYQVYVATRCLEWAEWSQMREDGLGRRVSQFGYTEPLPRGQWNGAPPVSARCIETEACVALLRLEKRILGDCIVLHYRTHPSWSAQMQADFMGLGLRTYWRRLEAAHSELLGHFLDRAAGLVPQTEQLRLQKRRVA